MQKRESQRLLRQRCGNSAVKFGSASWNENGRQFFCIPPHCRGNPRPGRQNPVFANLLSSSLSLSDSSSAPLNKRESLFRVNDTTNLRDTKSIAGKHRYSTVTCLPLFNFPSEGEHKIVFHEVFGSCMDQCYIISSKLAQKEFALKLFLLVITSQYQKLTVYLHHRSKVFDHLLHYCPVKRTVLCSVKRTFLVPAASSVVATAFSFEIAAASYY